MTIDAQTGRIDWTPDAIGSHAVRVRVSDGLLWTEQLWTLQVKDNVPLTAAIDPATALLSPNESHAIRIVPTDAASQVHVALTLDGVLVLVEDDLTAIVSSATPEWSYQGSVGRGYVRVIKGAKQHEIDSAKRIAEATGARVLHRGDASGPDLLIDGSLWEMKGLKNAQWTRNTLDGILREAVDNWRAVKRSDGRLFIDGTQV
jgi:hypothetical protein